MKAGNLEYVQNYTTGDLNISYSNLTSLEGCPEKVDGYFEGDSNQLTSFEHFPKYIRSFCSITHNKFTSFKDIDQHIEYIGSTLFATDMRITSGFSDLFGIDGLTETWIDNYEIRDIVNKYLPEKDLINFQDEMIKSGYESYL